MGPYCIRPTPGIKITFRYQNHLGISGDFDSYFLTYSCYINYMRWEPLRAMAVGYREPDHRYDGRRDSNVKLFVVAPDGTVIEMTDHHDLVSYLESHPDIAEAMSYYATV